MAQQFGYIQSLYESREKQGVTFKFNPQAASEIEQYLGGLNAMIEKYKDQEEIHKGLIKLRASATSTLISAKPEEEILAEIRQLTTIQGPDGQKINISHFTKGNQAEKIADAEVFKQKTQKRITQTMNNAIFLLQWKEDESVSKLVEMLKTIDMEQSAEQLNDKVQALVRDPLFQSYQTLKESYLKTWLQQFQGDIDKPIESMSMEDMQQVSKRIKMMMNQRMKEGNLIVCAESDKMKHFNETNHDLLHSENKTFWLNEPLVNEFIELSKAALNRFTFMLDKHYLIFQFRDEPCLYLIGFSEQSFSEAQPNENHEILLTPHVKPIIKTPQNTEKELRQDSFPSMGMYIDVVKDTVKPFFRALAAKVEFELSKEFKQHFRITD